jgi:hypothetical protein
LARAHLQNVNPNTREQSLTLLKLGKKWLIIANLLPKLIFLSTIDLGQQHCVHTSKMDRQLDQTKLEKEHHNLK